MRRTRANGEILGIYLLHCIVNTTVVIGLGYFFYYIFNMMYHTEFCVCPDYPDPSLIPRYPEIYTNPSDNCTYTYLNEDSMRANITCPEKYIILYGVATAGRMDLIVKEVIIGGLLCALCCQPLYSFYREGYWHWNLTQQDHLHNFRSLTNARNLNDTHYSDTRHSDSQSSNCLSRKEIVEIIYSKKLGYLTLMIYGILYSLSFFISNNRCRNGYFTSAFTIQALYLIALLCGFFPRKKEVFRENTDSDLVEKLNKEYSREACTRLIAALPLLTGLALVFLDSNESSCIIGQFLLAAAGILNQFTTLHFSSKIANLKTRINLFHSQDSEERDFERSFAHSKGF